MAAWWWLVQAENSGLQDISNVPRQFGQPTEHRQREWFGEVPF